MQSTHTCSLWPVFRRLASPGCNRYLPGTSVHVASCRGYNPFAGFLSKSGSGIQRNVVRTFGIMARSCVAHFVFCVKQPRTYYAYDIFPNQYRCVRWHSRSSRMDFTHLFVPWGFCVMFSVSVLPYCSHMRPSVGLYLFRSELTHSHATIRRE